MNLLNKLKNINKLWLAVAAFILIIIIATIIDFAIRNNNRLKQEMPINNFNKIVENLSSNDRLAIEQNLRWTIALNWNGGDVPPVSDAIIRDNSYKQFTQDGQFRTTFIIDIPSIKQSYLATKISSEEVETTGDYTNLITCLPPNDLIYGDFNCRDRLSEELGLSRADPITSLLPRMTDNSRVALVDYDSRNRGNLAVEIYVPMSISPGTDTLNFISNQLNEVREWIKSNGINPDDYNISHMVFR